MANGGHSYTGEQDNWLKEHVAGCPYKDLTGRFNERFGTQISHGAIKARAQKHGWKNGLYGVSPGMRQTQFKPGGPRPRTLPVGSESIYSSGRQKIVYIKTSDNPRVWKPKHRVVWEAAYGPIPGCCRTTFKDGNSLNCELGNLQLIKKSIFTPLMKSGIKPQSPTPEIAEAKEKFVEFISAKAAMQRNAREKRKALRDKKQEACKNG